MQAARLLEPRPRTLRAKLIEIARALQLEARFSKREILGIWLTLAPMGGNLEGVRAGSLAWFGASPRLLDAGAGGPAGGHPAPPGGAAPRPPPRPRPRRCATASCAATGGDRPHDIPAARIPLPRHARQAVAALPPRATRRHHARPAAADRAGTPRRRAAGDAAASAPRSPCWSPTRRSREIRALASGGAGAGEGRGGALDLTRAVRSPGSALKPFIYALAFQDGIAGPDTRARRPAAPVRRLRAGEFRPRLRRQRHRRRGAAALAEPAGGGAARPGRAAALRRHAEGGRRDAAPAARAPTRRCRWRSAAPASRCARPPALYAALAADGSAAPLRLRGDDPADAAPVPAARAPPPPSPAVLTQRLARRRAGRHRLEDRHELGRARRLGARVRPRHVVGVWVGRPGRHAAAGRDRPRAGAAAARPGVRPAAARPARSAAAARARDARPRRRAPTRCACCSRRRRPC